MADTAAPVQPTGPRWRRRLRWVLAVGATLLIAAELLLRFCLGLGDPPLSIADPDIEYMFKPSMSYRRFGNHIHYNAWSMRSDDFPGHKSSADEIRLMVIGDSVVNGGAPTDQAQLATSLLQKRLAGDLHRPVIAGNISAGSWGPPNELAYVQRYGLFDADVLVVVLSSHDYADAPTFEPTVGVDPNYPDHKPLLALQELFSRYGRFYLKRAVSSADVPSTAPASAAAIQACLTAEKQLIRLAQEQGVAVIVAQHLERKELKGHLMPGHDMIQQAAQEAGVTPIQLGPAFAAERTKGIEPYRDEIHPNAAGQRVIMETLVNPIEAALRRRSSAGTP